MAPVTRPRDRGQLILVAGLTVAVILVMLVLLLNTVIYTENLATRGIDSGAGDAVEYRATVVGSVEELIERENEHYDEGHPPEVGVEKGIIMIDRTLSEQYLDRGVVAEVHANENIGDENSCIIVDEISSCIIVDENSPRIWQKKSGELTATGNESEWPVATNVIDVEQFILSVDSIDPYEDSEEADNNRLQIVIDDPETENPWTLQINASNAASYEVVVNDSEPLTYQTDTLKIDLVSGTINENPEFSSPTKSGTIEFRNGDTTTGTFELHAIGSPNDNNLTKYDGGSGDDPYYTYPVESVNLPIHYENSRVRFVTEETITPVEEEP